MDGINFGKSRADCGADTVDCLVKLARLDIPGVIIEAGSYRCGASIAMASASNKTVYCFDTFGGIPNANQVGFENFKDADFEEVSKATAPYNIKLVRGRHEDTVPKFSKFCPPISLIFLDSDFYQSHKICLEHFWPRVSPGGSILFHDWTFEEVQRAVNEYFTDKSECELFGYYPDLMPNGKGIITKVRKAD